MATKPDHKPSIAPIVGPDDPRRFTDSGIEIQPIYSEEDVADGLEERLGDPGEYPFTRGVHPEMYRTRRWTMRQYAGYASAKETNERFQLPDRARLDRAVDGLRPAHPARAATPTTRCAPARSAAPAWRSTRSTTCGGSSTASRSSDVSTSMTINAPAAVLLLLYELVGEEQGVESKDLTGTTQNDILKEYIARGNFIYPPEPAMRLTTDLFAYCAERVPKWNTISISGYHMREKGCSAVQEVGFTLANAIAYVQAAIDAGLEVDDFGPRLAFFFNGHNNVFQEVAKFRAARRMWAQIMKERFGAENAEVADDPLPHADRRRHARRAAAAQQHRARGAAGLRGGMRRHAVAAHERLRRGAGAADRDAPPGSRCAPSRSSRTSPAPPTRSTRSPAPTSSRP